MTYQYIPFDIRWHQYNKIRLEVIIIIIEEEEEEEENNNELDSERVVLE